MSRQDLASRAVSFCLDKSAGPVLPPAHASIRERLGPQPARRSRNRPTCSIEHPLARRYLTRYDIWSRHQRSGEGRGFSFLPNRIILSILTFLLRFFHNVPNTVTGIRSRRLSGQRVGLLPNRAAKTLDSRLGPRSEPVHPNRGSGTSVGIVNAQQLVDRMRG